MIHPQPPTDWDSADPEERRNWIGHVESCSPCRDRWVSEDPSRMFSFLIDCPVVDDETERLALDRLSGSVRENLRPVRPAGRWFHLVAAAVLIMALVAPLAAWMLQDRPEPVLPLAEVDLLFTPGQARVIDLSVGDTQVVMIFDPRLEL
jgi:hypothetical protein